MLIVLPPTKERKMLVVINWKDFEHKQHETTKEWLKLQEEQIGMNRTIVAISIPTLILGFLFGFFVGLAL